MNSPLAIVWFALTLGSAAICFADAPTGESSPERTLDRYTHIWTAKPFVAATVVTPQAESLVQRFAITGYAHFGGSDVVFLLDRTTLNRFTVTEQKSANGVDLLSVVEKADAGKLKARIRVGGEVAEIAYDVATAGLGSMGENPVQPPSPDGGMAVAPNIPPSIPSQDNAINPVPVQKRIVPIPRPPRVIQRKPIQTQ